MKNPFNGNNDCVFCENENDDATCSYYGEKIVWSRNDSPGARALRRQTSCRGFSLLERMREDWEKQVGRKN